LKALEEVICWRPDWMADALCQEYHGVDFFPGAGKSPASALAVCHACPVISECLAHALEHRIGDGVWGGTSEAQRKQMLRSMGRARSATDDNPPDFWEGLMQPTGPGEERE
jgi:hypothetical protein